jgi:hypothetical protein
VRQDPDPTTTSERDALGQYLDYQRETILLKTEGEEWQIDWAADPDYEFRVALGKDPDELRRRYRDACDRSRQITAAARDLDQLSVSTAIGGKPFTLRWMMLHLIEETARHAGHADLLREAIDGAVGE